MRGRTHEGVFEEEVAELRRSGLPPARQRGFYVRVTLAVAAAVVLVFVSLLAGYFVEHSPSLSGDTPGLVMGAAVANDCLGAGTFTRCGTSTALRAQIQGYRWKSAVRPWPPFQYLIAMPLLALGTSQSHVLLALALFNAAAFFLVLALFAIVPWRTGNPALIPALVAIVLVSPLLFYADQTFGEMLAAGLAVAAVAAVALRASPSVIAVATCASGLTKETAPIFAVALGLIVALRSDGRRALALAVPVMCGGIVAWLIDTAFNVFRYGHVQNIDYLAPVLQVHSTSVRLNFFAALLVSPNGGIVWFWTAAAVFLAATLTTALLARPRLRKRGLLALALLAVIGALLLGLADWYAPFGWIAWGPRLTLPWVPAFLLVAAVACPAEARRVVHADTAGTARATLTFATLAITGLPQVAVLYDTLAPGRLFNTNTASHCPIEAIWGTTGYFNCVRYLAWRHSPVLLDALHGLLTVPGFLFGFAMCAALAGLGYVANGPARQPAAAVAVTQPEPLSARYET